MMPTLRTAVARAGPSTGLGTRRALYLSAAARLPALPRTSRPTRNTRRPKRNSDIERSTLEPFGDDGAYGSGLVSSRTIAVPPDPDGVLQDSHAARELLAHDTLVIVRQIEMLNIFVGFEQANRYAIYSPEGDLVGFLAEEEQTIVSTMTRQLLRTHRPFRALIMDRHGKPILWVRRPFQFINSRIHVRASEDEDSKLIGEAQQEWHPWRRRYNVFQTRDTDTFSQFARIDGGFWAWDFWLKDKDDRLVASINRNFRGLGRELFTDTGQYVVRFDAAGTELDMPPGSSFEVQGQKLILPTGPEGSLTLDQRAMTLATAVSIDFDYFSRHSGAGGFGFPFFMWGGDGGGELRGGGSSTDDGVGAAGAGAAAGAASGAMQGQDTPMNEEELIYGPQEGREAGQGPVPGEYDYEDQGEETFFPDEEETMEDPWGSSGDGDGLFGGGGGGGGGGDWGDWS